MALANTQIYKKNIAALTLRNPELAAFLENLETSAYEIVRAPSGDLRLKIQKGATDTFVFVDDADDPTECVKSFLPTPTRSRNLFVMMGMGLGYLFFEAAKAFPESRILVIESDARIFKMALSCFDFSSHFASSQYEFFVAIKFELLSHYLLRRYLTQNDNYLRLAVVQFLIHSQNVVLAERYYKRAREIFDLAVQDFWNKLVGNNYHDTLQGLDQTLTNLPLLQRMGDLEKMRGCYQDRVGIVVSSGPSLDSKLPYLKKIQDKVVMLAADSALKKLLDYGITPLGVSSLERTESIAGLYRGYVLPKNLFLIAPLLLYPNVFENFPGPILTFYRNCFPFMWLPPLLEKRDVGLSCAHLNFFALTLFGCREIAFVGQDLAYHRETGTSHFGGMYPYALEAMQELGRVDSDDNNGGLIATNEFWIMFRNIFTEMFALHFAKRPVFNVIEKEHGLMIHGATRIDAEDYFSRLANETTLMPLSFSLAHTALQARLPEFEKKLQHTLQLTLSQLAPIRQQFEKIAGANHFDDYLQMRDSWKRDLSSATWFLLDELLKPQTKRFETNAFGVWTQSQFDEQKKILASEAVQIFDDLVRVLKKHQDVAVY